MRLGITIERWPKLESIMYVTEKAEEDDISSKEDG